jgi:anhydro-N-acetylmuramic acid kinase
MSGTSFDAIEVAAAEYANHGGVVDMTLLGALSVEMPPELRERIATTLPPSTTTLEAVCRLDNELGQAFAAAALRGKMEICGDRADLVCCPGQTVFHWVEDGRARGSLQLGRTTWIAEKTGLPVVFDLYNRDIACGGQGAPLSGLSHRLLLAGIEGSRATLNIGGIANVTVVTDTDDLFCYDVGPGNALLDTAVAHFTQGRERFDRDGRMAASGTVHDALLKLLLAEPFYAQAPPKSTGKELFHLGYLQRLLARVGPVPNEDVLATLTQLTATVIGQECRRWGVRHVVASGGGMQNPVLAEAVRRACAPALVVTSESVGLPVTSVEAYGLSFLGYLTASGVEAAIPSATGARRASLMGSMTPGLSTPSFPQLGGPPTELRIRAADQTTASADGLSA